MRRQRGVRPIYRQATVTRTPNQQRRPIGITTQNTIDIHTPMYGTPVGIGRPLAERPVNMRADVEERRRELQEKYRQEAAAAEEKKLRRERKKREEWLKRQEFLVRPGNRLGHGTQTTNFQRDLVEHQSFIDLQPQEDSSRLDERDRQLRMLVQQGMERKVETEVLNKKIQQFGPRKAYVQQRTEMAKSTFKNENSGPANPMKPMNFLGVAQNAPSPASHINDTAQETSGHVLGSGDSSSGLPPTSANRQNEVDYREQMRAARLRMQTQYNEEVKRATEAKAQEIDNMAEELGQISLK